MAMNQSCYALKSKGEHKLNNLWLFVAMQFAVEHFKQSASEGVFRSIVINTFKSIPFICPDGLLTQRYGDQVRPIFDQINCLSQQNEKLKQARDQLLPRLMSGKLDVSRLPVEPVFDEAV
jgi:type I restriction enzyme S subunit